MNKTKHHQPNLEPTLVALEHMTAAQLRDKFLEVFGEAARTGNRPFLIKRIAWRLQSLAEGGLSERAIRRAEELARDADLRTTIPKPPKTSPGGGVTRTSPAPKAITTHDRLPIPGTVLTRKYRGQQVEVKVLPHGFEYRGQTYRSLSAVATAVTGSHWNGLLFFGLTTPRKANP